MEDSKIVDLYLARDETAISLTAGKYGAKLRHIADSIVENAETAEECENDTYLEAWNLIPPHEPRNYLFPFLGKITRHLAIDVCRKTKTKKRDALYCELTVEMEECIPGQTDVESDIEAVELSRRISKFLDGSPADQRSVFVRRYWFFDTISEISRKTGFSQSKVKSVLFRMREKLREELTKEGYIL
ncbi:MAG: RNA polymerase sigma factor [Clostridia bacterium]|nr:RNA polymerase sigma factor [Clostridia bacterium]